MKRGFLKGFLDILVEKVAPSPEPIPEADNPDGRTGWVMIPGSGETSVLGRDESLPRREPRPRPYEEAPNQWRKPADDEG